MSSSGPFSDYAETYWEMGYSIIPIRKGEKRPFLDYSLYRDKQCTREELDEWIMRYGDGNIAVVPGKASGLCMIALDNKNQPDLMSKALSLIPRSPVERFGSKGLGIIVRYNGQSGRKLYYKGKEIGEMIVNTVFVIPPSIHPDTGKAYEWTGYTSLDAELKDDMLDELPCPTDDDINRFEHQLEHSDADVDPDYFKQVTGRNNRLKAVCGALIEKGMLPEQIAPRLLAEDLMMNGNNSLFHDRTEFKKLADTPLAAAYLFCSSIFRTYLKNASVKGKDVPQFDKKQTQEVQENIDYTPYKQFFQERLKNCRRDKIDGVLKHRDWRGFWQPVGNRLGHLRSLSTDVGLKPHKIKDHYDRYEREHSMEMLWKVEPWDGRDHIAEMMVHVSCANMTNPEMIDLVKEWMVRAYRRHDSGEQNSMILFQGGQGVGKDVFIDELCGGFAPYFSNFTETSQEKDMFMQIAKNVIINISEFDKLNKKHPGMIKDLISRKSAQFRPSHMQHFEDFRMNASFIGSVNPKNFLTDHTGNRRFWVFDSVQIDWGYPKGRGAQILAQARELASQNFTAPVATVQKMARSVVEMSPQPLDDIITEVWNSHFDIAARSCMKSGDLAYNECSDAVRAVQRACGFRSESRARAELIRLGARKRSNGSRYNKIDLSH